VSLRAWAVMVVAVAAALTGCGGDDAADEPVRPVHSFNPLVQIETGKGQMEETRA